MENEKAVKNSLLTLWTKARTSELFWITFFTFLTFLGAQAAIPVQPVPFTLQTLVVLLAGAFLGSKNGAYSMGLYLVLGTIGLPIFANFGFGFAKIFGPTGGYLLSFPFAAYLVGYILEKRRNKVTIAISFFAGNLMIILTGALFLSLFFNGDFQAAFYSGAAIFSIWGLVKVSLAIAAYYTISKKVSKLP